MTLEELAAHLEGPIPDLGIAWIQRRLRIGYAQAQGVMAQLISTGAVSVICQGDGAGRTYCYVPAGRRPEANQAWWLKSEVPHAD